ncbi:iron ABC transporter permease [Nocardioides sp. zg-536]|uniref:Iron ABC transporter permease n=1 Tax=Nocardioides faecalis TaxID=2803858 RepID=A0A938Y271_9ACTN|nr:iron ABC transporter permease [Nocardioides faecalis]QVI60742.1 iron ABC transporter permease [Nocardioides faecalis]
MHRSAAILLAALLVVVTASVLIGSNLVSPAAITDSAHPEHAIFVKRFERTLTGLVIGAAFALAGACMQGLTRNPLADPGLLGVNAGAAFAMVVAITVLGISTLQQYLWFGFLGAALATVTVHLVAGVGRGGATPVKLTIAGAALTAGLTSWTTALLLVDRSAVEQIRRWQVGSVAGRDPDVLLTALPALVVGAVLALAMTGALNSFALGDDLARGLGRRTGRDRVLVGTAIVLLAGTGTAVAGPIGFVGLVVPHVVRRLVGADHRLLVPFSAGYGAVLVVAADTLGRVVLPPTEVPVGLTSTLIGLVAIIWLVRQGRVAKL